MDAKTYQEIFDIATDARGFMQHFAKNNPHIGDVRTLACYCAIAAAHLFTALKENGFDAKVAVNDLHAFVLVNKGKYIVDVTATQFGDEYPEVVLMPLNATLRYETFWKPQKTFTDLTRVREHQVRRQWAEEQRVVFEIC